MPEPGPDWPPAAPTGAHRRAYSVKGHEMTSEQAPAPAPGNGSQAGALPFDTSKAHQARVYDYLLGGCFR